jgi:hypothetical protein
MNTNKELLSTIRDALDLVIGQADHRMESNTLHWSTVHRCQEAIAALDQLEAQQKPTDEQLYAQAMADVTPESLERMDRRAQAIDANRAQQQPKRLTDEEIERILDEDDAEAERNGENDPSAYKNDEVYEMYMERASSYKYGKRDGLRYARDNGYIGGLSVEEVMKEIQDWALGADAAMYQPDESDFNRLRALLTAKAQGK